MKPKIIRYRITLLPIFHPFIADKGVLLVL